MKLLILSDIHGNLSALNAVLEKEKDYDAAVLLGDLIDYGMHSNEVIEEMHKLSAKIICNIWGNHEKAIVGGEYDRFSSERGRKSAKNTKMHLSATSWNYINEKMVHGGWVEFEAEGKWCLAIHGSSEDKYWKAVCKESDFSPYIKYDYVFSGHSHIPHYMEEYYPADDELHRNKKKTIFINPGSVGQPRNLNPRAQFVVLDTVTEEISFKKADYNVAAEQESFDGSVDEFYKIRLENGV